MNVFKKLIVISSMTLAVLSFSLFVSAHASDSHMPPEEKRATYAIDVRQAVFTLMGSNMGPLGAMARGKMPFNAELAEKNATRIAQLTAMITDGFKLDTSEYDSLETGALDVIWDNLEEFEEKALAANKAAISLVAAASTGDEGATKKAIAGLGKTCGSCHDDFKVEDD